MSSSKEELRRIQELSQARQARIDEEKYRQNRLAPSPRGPRTELFGLLCLLGGVLAGYLYFADHPDLGAGSFPAPNTEHLFAKAMVALTCGLSFGIFAHIFVAAQRRSQRARQGRTERKTGIVEHQHLVHTSSSSQGGSLLYSLVLTVAYEAKGAVHRAQVQPVKMSTNVDRILEGWKARYPMGSELEIWHSPDAPEDVGLKGPGQSPWLLPLALFYIACWVATGFGMVGLPLVLT